MPAWFGMFFYIIQLTYYILMLVFVGYAVVQLKRYVNFKMGVGRSGKMQGPDASDEKISVDAFVE